VSEEALLIHALTEKDLSLPVAVLNSEQIADLINNHNTVLTF
jgi:sulfur relay (sulfurtransferase) DsrF/TusC family protein